MLRALGLQPVVSLPKSEIDLELESIFIGSPMTFGELCRNILGIIGLSKTSIALSWEVSSKEAMKSPKHFLEFLNLQLVSNCVK
ncbi:unnamed protein product [Heterobilharzia americana]|nr:unnamed protein product [Heterobilharzia americana]